MHWRLSHRADPIAAAIADRHYNRQSVGHPQFVPPGRCLVLLTDDATALWVSSYQEYVDHAWPGHWNNTLFRREGGDVQASALIRQAVACTRWAFGEPTRPMLTFIDPRAIRRKRDPGRCYIKAGFKLVGETKIHRHLAFVLDPADMPDTEPPIGAQFALAM